MNAPRKRLIFHHQGKTGGSTFLDWLDPNLSRVDYTCDLERKLSNDQICDSCFHSEIIHIHGCFQPLPARLGTEKWNKLTSSSIRVTVLRNPVNRIESEWSFFHDKKMGSFLPHTPCLAERELGAAGDYFTQQKEDQLEINEWIELYNEYHLTTNNENLRNESIERNLRPEQPIYNRIAIQAHGSLFPYYSQLNLQTKQIRTHLGGEFIQEASKSAGALILATEYMSRQTAELILRDKEFGRFFSIRHSSAKPSIESFTNELDRKRTNVRSDENKKRDPHKLTAMNRYRFARLNQVDIANWAAATRGNFMT